MNADSRLTSSSCMQAKPRKDLRQSGRIQNKKGQADNTDEF